MTDNSMKAIELDSRPGALTSQVAVVTGAGQGIAREVVIRLSTNLDGRHALLIGLHRLQAKDRRIQPVVGGGGRAEGRAPSSEIEAATPVTEPTPTPTAGRAETLRQAIALSERLQEIITDTETEFKQLPVFVRPLSQRRFRSKAGQRFQDWARTATELTEQLRKMETADATAEEALRAAYPRLKALLDGLVCHPHGRATVPTDYFLLHG